MFKVSPAILQTFSDSMICVLEDRVQYSTIHILNVFCDGHLQIINCVGTVRTQSSLYCNLQVHRDFLITLYKGLMIDQFKPKQKPKPMKVVL
jgi:hypothetical protein